MIGLELCKEAVEDAQYNARENGKWKSLVICTCTHTDAHKYYSHGVILQYHTILLGCFQPIFTLK